MRGSTCIPGPSCIPRILWRKRKYREAHCVAPARGSLRFACGDSFEDDMLWRFPGQGRATAVARGEGWRSSAEEPSGEQPSGEEPAGNSGRPPRRAPPQEGRHPRRHGVDGRAQPGSRAPREIRKRSASERAVRGSPARRRSGVPPGGRRPLRVTRRSGRMPGSDSGFCSRTSGGSGLAVRPDVRTGRDAIRGRIIRGGIGGVRVPC